jgi:hypothetical protein
MVVDLLPGPAYWGVEKMLAAGKIFDNTTIPFFKENVTAESLSKTMDHYCNGATGFVIIRENVRGKNFPEWMRTFKAVLDDAKDKYGYFELNEKACPEPTDVVRAYGSTVTKEAFDRCRVNANRRRLQGIDAVLGLSPPKTIFIFIKDMLLAGKTLNTAHVLMVIDFPFESSRSGNVDRTVQGLTGRCCGYGKNKNVVIITNKRRVQSYVDWVKGGVAPAMPATHARVQDGAELVAVRSAYVKPLSSALQDLVVGVAEEGQEKDD